ncbi:MAG: GumC family protein, partial [Alphaproteobacteria bacterium]
MNGDHPDLATPNPPVLPVLPVPPVQRAPRYGAAAAADMLDLRGFLGILKRAKYLIAGVTMMATVATAIVSKQLTPLYAAQATIVIELDNRNIVDIAKVDEGLLSTDAETLETEAAIISSRGLARLAVDHLDLLADPEWNPALPALASLENETAFNTRLPSWGIGAEENQFADASPPQSLWRRQLTSLRLAGFSGYWQQLQALLDAWGVAEMLGLDIGEAESLALDDIDIEDLTIQIISGYLGNLSVEPRRDSRVVQVQYVSPDPEFAARAANTTVDLYLEAQSIARAEATNQAAIWLQRQVSETQERFLAADRKLEQFRSDSGLTTIGGTVLPAQQLAQFSAELGRSRTELAEATARHEQVQRLLNVDPDHLATAAAVLNSSLVESLRVQELALDRRLAELRSQYREGHPQLIFATAEQVDLRRGIAAEIDKIAANLENERDIIQARVTALATEVGRLQGNLSNLSAAEVTLRSLESEADASRTLFQTLLQRLKETGVQDAGLQGSDARVLDFAVIPLNPFFPRKKVMVILAFCAAFALSLLFAVLREFLHPGFRSLAQTESETGMPTLGMIPNTPPAAL